jgi:hypothetical protein
MFPFQPIDLSKLSYATILDIVAPFFPGGTIALGWLYGHDAVLANLHDEKTLKIIIAVFVMYVVGFAMVYLTAFELSGVALAVLIRKTEIHEPWKNSEWRRLASNFLGAELSPPLEEPPSVTPEQPTAFTNAEKLLETLKQNSETRMAPLNFKLRWQRWYEILRARFPMQNPQLAFGNLYFSTLNSIGWAGLISAYISSRHIGWLVWSACVLTIAVSHVSFTLNFKQQQHLDPSGDQLAAEMLKAIKTRDLSVGKSSGSKQEQ